jgi:uncharacterized membrane-anchored protein YjiN (DUF445 family)
LENEEMMQRMKLRRAMLERDPICKGLKEELLQKVAQSELEVMAKVLLERIVNEVAKQALLNKIFAEIEQNNLIGDIEKRMRMEEEEIGI